MLCSETALVNAYHHILERERRESRTRGRTVLSKFLSCALNTLIRCLTVSQGKRRIGHAVTAKHQRTSKNWERWICG